MFTVTAFTHLVDGMRALSDHGGRDDRKTADANRNAPARDPKPSGAARFSRKVAAAWRRLAARAAERRARARRAWLRHTTEQEIAKLSPQMRKDIGWPTRQDY